MLQQNQIVPMYQFQFVDVAEDGFDVMAGVAGDAACLSGAVVAQAACDVLTGVVEMVHASGSKDPIADARLLMAGLHGLVSFAASGRMNTGDLSRSDRAVALASARDLASRVHASTSKPKPPTPSKRRARP